MEYNIKITAEGTTSSIVEEIKIILKSLEQNEHVHEVEKKGIIEWEFPNVMCSITEQN